MAAVRHLFVARERGLLALPEGMRLERAEQLALAPGALPALLALTAAGYRLVLLVPTLPAGGAEASAAQWLVGLLASQGLRFAEIRHGIETPAARDAYALELLRAGSVEAGASAVVAAGEAELELARTLGIEALRLGPGGFDWPGIAHRLAARPRTARIERNTKETRVRVEVDLDREAAAEVQTGIGFFDHMLEQIGRHGGFALSLTCAGDTHVDEHHTVEDSALALGEALRRALGDKRGIARYGFHLPMDEARAEALLDLSGRAYFVFEGRFGREQVGGLATELVPHFFRSLCDALGANLHLKVEGENAHHMVEACFKATARALRMALRREGSELPSTKGVL